MRVKAAARARQVLVLDPDFPSLSAVAHATPAPYCLLRMSSASATHVELVPLPHEDEPLNVAAQHVLSPAYLHRRLFFAPVRDEVFHRVVVDSMETASVLFLTVLRWRDQLMNLDEHVFVDLKASEHALVLVSRQCNPVLAANVLQKARLGQPLPALLAPAPVIRGEDVLMRCVPLACCNLGEVLSPLRRKASLLAEIVGHLLMERRVVVVGIDANQASHFVYALQCLMFPLEREAAPQYLLTDNEEVIVSLRSVLPQLLGVVSSHWHEGGQRQAIESYREGGRLPVPGFVEPLQDPDNPVAILDLPRASLTLWPPGSVDARLPGMRQFTERLMDFSRRAHYIDAQNRDVQRSCLEFFGRLLMSSSEDQTQWDAAENRGMLLFTNSFAVTTLRQKTVSVRRVFDCVERQPAEDLPILLRETPLGEQVRRNMNFRRESVFHHAARHTADANMLEAVWQCGLVEDVNLRDALGRTALFVALESIAPLRKVRFLRSLGASTNILTNDLRSPVTCCISWFNSHREHCDNMERWERELKEQDLASARAAQLKARLASAARTEDPVPLIWEILKESAAHVINCVSEGTTKNRPATSPLGLAIYFALFRDKPSAYLPLIEMLVQRGGQLPQVLCSSAGVRLMQIALENGKEPFMASVVQMCTAGDNAHLDLFLASLSPDVHQLIHSIRCGAGEISFEFHQLQEERQQRLDEIPQHFHVEGMRVDAGRRVPDVAQDQDGGCVAIDEEQTAIRMQYALDLSRKDQ